MSKFTISTTEKYFTDEGKKKLEEIGFDMEKMPEVMRAGSLKWIKKEDSIQRDFDALSDLLGIVDLAYSVNIQKTGVGYDVEIDL